MEIIKNKDLTALNTFGMTVKASEYIEVTSAGDVTELVRLGKFKNPFLILGGGSNMLFTKDFDGLVVRNRIRGLEVIKETDEAVIVRIGAGENWHETVLYCVDHHWCGIENLSLIPGCVGAAPIQNIGAYGVEIKDVLTSVQFINLDTGNPESLDNEECKFGYRSSIFKNELKNKVLITSIELRLLKNGILKLDYGAIRDELSKYNDKEIGIQEVSEAVIAIRQSKLPDPAELGNSGSFFKNPVIPMKEYNTLVKHFPDVRSYKAGEGFMKLAAGWLIEQCGWKGKRVGNTGSHAKQALVLVNYGGARGEEVKALADNIIASVREKFGVQLEPEVNII